MTGGAAHGVDVLCIGSVLWDVIGRSPGAMRPGADVPGRIRSVPGGVALNIALALARRGLRPALLSVVGRDPEGDALVAACAAAGLETATLTRADDLLTDRYMAIEDAGGLVAAIADAHSLEQAGGRILAPLADGRLPQPWTGPVALDGNLTTAQLAEIAASPLFAGADLRVAPASPGKAERLRPLLAHPRAVLYTNLEEAGLICGTRFAAAPEAAAGLVAQGAARALVTDGARTCADAMAGAPAVADHPPAVTVARITGAGDTFMAVHLAAELAGAPRPAALALALRAAADYVSGITGP